MAEPVSAALEVGKDPLQPEKEGQGPAVDQDLNQNAHNNSINISPAEPLIISLTVTLTGTVARSIPPRSFHQDFPLALGEGFSNTEDGKRILRTETGRPPGIRGKQLLINSLRCQTGEVLTFGASSGSDLASGPVLTLRSHITKR